MSWFSDTDVNDIPDDPNHLPNDTYKMKVISAKVGETKPNPNNPNWTKKTGITFKYQIIEGSYSTFFPLNEWVRVPDGNTKEDETTRMLSYLKMRLLAFGFTPEEIQDFGPETLDEVMGREFYGTTSIKKDGDRVNIKVVKFDPISDGEGMNEFSPDDDNDIY